MSTVTTALGDDVTTEFFLDGDIESVTVQTGRHRLFDVNAAIAQDVGQSDAARRTPEKAPAEGPPDAPTV